MIMFKKPFQGSLLALSLFALFAAGCANSDPASKADETSTTKPAEAKPEEPKDIAKSDALANPKNPKMTSKVDTTPDITAPTTTVPKEGIKVDPGKQTPTDGSKPVKDLTLKEPKVKPEDIARKNQAKKVQPAVRVEPSGDHTKYVGTWIYKDKKFDKVNADIEKKAAALRAKGQKVPPYMVPIMFVITVNPDGTYVYEMGPRGMGRKVSGTIASSPTKLVLNPYMDVKKNKPLELEDDVLPWNLELSKDGKSIDTIYKLKNGKQLMKFYKQ